MQNVICLKNISKYVYENIQNDNLNFYKKMINYFSPEKTKKYLVKNCSINLEKGKSLAIIGLNGAGKSTLMKIISGVISPSEGEIKILNYTPYDRNKFFLKKIGVVFGHKSSLLWDIPLKFSLELHKTIYQIDDSSYQSRLNYLTEVLSLKECLNKKVKFMSLGERVKSDLLMNMLHNPELILLDEPTIGVDMESKIKIREFINNEKENNNCTFILTSHDPADIENCCDKINILAKGEIVFSEETEVLKNKYNEKVKIIVKKVDKNYEYSLLKDTISGFIDATFNDIGNNLNIVFDKKNELSIINTLIKLKITSFEVKKMSFEEILADKFQIFKSDHEEIIEDE